jgi:hypothetical protein
MIWLMIVDLLFSLFLLYRIGQAVVVNRQVAAFIVAIINDMLAIDARLRLVEDRLAGRPAEVRNDHPPLFVQKPAPEKN